MPGDIERKFALFNLLASSRYPLTREEIFKRLRVFYSDSGRKTGSAKKMFERDKAELTAEGFAVAAEAGTDGVERYILPRHQAWLGDFQLADSQARLLREAIEDPSIAGQMMGQGLLALKKLLAFNAPFDEGLQGEKPENPAGSANYLKAHEALLGGKVLEVDYPSQEGRLERRCFSPYAIFFRYGSCYLVAGCHRDQIPKVIALDRAKRVRISNKLPLPQPKGFNPGRYIRSGRYDYDPALGTSVRFRVNAAEARGIRERHSRHILSGEKNGPVLCEFFVTHPARFFRFLLAFGPGAEIVSPPEYRLMFKKFLKGVSA